MTVELALTPDGGWTATTAELVAAAASSGFTSLGIGAARAGEAAVAAYRERNLRCHEVLALVLTDDAASMATAAETLAEAAATMGAPWVLTVFRTPLSSSTAPIVQRCAATFAAAGAGMAVEFSPLGALPTISDGLEVVRAANAGAGARAGLMIDSWHFSVGPSTWAELATVPLDEIAYVQFADALPLDPTAELMHETTNRRTLPGEGVLELDRFASALLDRGWDGVVSVEVLSEELRGLPIDTVVDRLYETTARCWR